MTKTLREFVKDANPHGEVETRKPARLDPMELDELLRISSLGDLVGLTDEYTVSNYVVTRTLDASTATLSDVANFLCTLVDDLKTKGPLG